MNISNVSPDEPDVALFGVDNTVARRACESAGFRLVIDAGLGAGYTDFRGLRIRTFPGTSKAAHIWASNNIKEPKLAIAYEQMLSDGADQCGVTTLATRSVGAPFVGCITAAYTISEYIKRKMGSSGLNYLDMNLRDPERIDTA